MVAVLATDAVALGSLRYGDRTVPIEVDGLRGLLGLDRVVDDGLGLARIVDVVAVQVDERGDHPDRGLGGLCHPARCERDDDQCREQDPDGRQPMGAKSVKHRVPSPFPRSQASAGDRRMSTGRVSRRPVWGATLTIVPAS
jgi:hypothetical protein